MCMSVQKMSIFGKCSGFDPFTKTFLIPNDICIEKIDSKKFGYRLP